MDEEDKLCSKMPLHWTGVHQKPINNSQNESKLSEKIMPFFIMNIQSNILLLLKSSGP